MISNVQKAPLNLFYHTSPMLHPSTCILGKSSYFLPLDLMSATAGASVAVLVVLGAVVGLSKSGWDLEGDFGAVLGLDVSSGDLVLVFVGAASCLGFEAVAGCHKKNSCNRVLTTSGHSIMTMWLPSSRTFRKPSKRIYKVTETKVVCVGTD